MSATLDEPASPALDLADPEVLARVQQDYLDALPRITEHAEIQFRGIRDPGAHDDAIANVVGIGWKHWLAAVRQGKDPNEFVSAIADYAVRQVRSGRRLDRQERPKDVLSPRAQRTNGFHVEQMSASGARSHEALYSDPHGQEKVDALEQRLTDNTVTSPPDQAAFREQWGMFLEQLGEFKRPVVEDMAAGEDTQDLAAKYGKTPGRISQIRREAEQTWKRIDRGDDGGQGR